MKTRKTRKSELYAVMPLCSGFRGELLPGFVCNSMKGIEVGSLRLIASIPCFASPEMASLMGFSRDEPSRIVRVVVHNQRKRFTLADSWSVFGDVKGTLQLDPNFSIKVGVQEKFDIFPMWPELFSLDVTVLAAAACALRMVRTKDKNHLGVIHLIREWMLTGIRPDLELMDSLLGMNKPERRKEGDAGNRSKMNHHDNAHILSCVFLALGAMSRLERLKGYDDLEEDGLIRDEELSCREAAASCVRRCAEKMKAKEKNCDLGLIMRGAVQKAIEKKNIDRTSSDVVIFNRTL